MRTIESWCQFELTSCPAICKELDPRPVMVNECDAVSRNVPPVKMLPRLTDIIFQLQEQISYGCICGNGQQPDVEQYSLTLPYFTCQEFGNQCVKNCGRDDHTCQNACREDNPCGAQNPKPPNSSATASAPRSSSTSNTDDDEDGVFEGLAGDKTPSRAAALEMGRTYGLAVVLGGLFASFAML